MAIIALVKRGRSRPDIVDRQYFIESVARSGHVLLLRWASEKGTVLQRDCSTDCCQFIGTCRGQRGYSYSFRYMDHYDGRPHCRDLPWHCCHPPSCLPPGAIAKGLVKAGGTGAGPHIATEETGVPGIAAIRQARRALDDVGMTGRISLVYAGGIRNGGDVAKAVALGADAVAIGHAALMALNCNRDTPEADYEKEMGVKAGECYHCHTGRCPVGVATQDPELRKRLDPDAASERVYNFLHTLAIECQMMARACGKTNIHSLEPEDLAALTMEASACAQVPIAGSQHTVGRPDMTRF